jgi:DNA-directed RNA polymerase subunit beta'
VEHHVPQDRQLLVHAGDRVEAGDQLIDGPLVPHDILRIKGEEALQQYLIGGVDSVYRSQNVTINHKHVEVIISQMMRKVRVDQTGDTEFLPGDVVDRFKFAAENERLSKSVKISDAGDTTVKAGQIVLKAELTEINEKAEAEGGEPARGKKPKLATASTVLLGITKASLQSESFISAASFQETTKVLTEAAISSANDELIGLKENVILGHLIPAGTAFKPHLNITVRLLGEPIPAAEDVPAGGAEALAGVSRARSGDGGSWGLELGGGGAVDAMTASELQAAKLGTAPGTAVATRPDDSDAALED